ncbi:bifunctional hydroxymethylpyrimidine kinase/phosphomethylpyrimidine kinase [Arcanobacterium haemolyticum]|nr:bifunctional hydroxymethylpyrimidine kinase/phosphomethylpyrimidine kinase [Arcanobacterium haemolyticum]
MTSTTLHTPRVLSIAGTDPSGGAGIHADLKSISAAGGYAMGVVTAIVSQNTQGVRSIHMPDAHVLRDQLDAVSDDVAIDAVKIGMLGDITYITTVSDWLQQVHPPVVVLDPVMVATSGDRLLIPEAEAALIAMLPLADIITPNIPELEVIAGREPGSVKDDDEALALARKVAHEHNVYVLVKGGHLDGALVVNTLVGPQGVVARSSCPRVATTSTHGTGCSMSSALATRLGLAGVGADGAGAASLRITGTSVADAAQDALSWTTQWLFEAITHGSDLEVGHGHGPVDHMHLARRMSRAAKVTPWLAHTVDAAALLTAAPPAAAASTTIHTTEPLIEPAGPWTSRLWHASRDILRATASLPFIRRLADGTLDPADFTFYQFQDSLYLDRYAKALAMLGAKAHEGSEKVHWGTGAAVAIEVEQELHRTWLGNHPDVHIDRAISPVTSGYTDFLLARTATDDYVVGAAAVLPCYWMYAHIGFALTEANHDEHPFHDWLTTYADDAFLASTREAIAIVEHQFERAGNDARERALRAYLTACQWELEFFDQAYRRQA